MPAEAKPNSELLCEDGLPAPRAEDPEGDIDTTALRNALSPLHDAALTCAQSSAGRAQLGGKLTLSLRIDAGGHAKDLCFKSDSIGEAKLRRCLAESVRALTLPKPDPSGFVDLELPLNLEMAGPSAQRALCN
jgi:hypothetical protein